MKTRTHVIVGAAVPAITGIFFVPNLFWYFWVGAIGGAAPDLFEPPISRFHRNFFHSKIMVIIMVVVTLIAWAKTGGNSNDAYFVMAFGMGYVSHLLMDSRTYMGLP